MAQLTSTPDDLLDKTLDDKLMETLREQIILAIRPTLELVVNSLLAPFKEELLQSARVVSTVAVAEQLEPVMLKCKKLTAENAMLKQRLDAAEIQANTSSLVFSGFAETPGTGPYHDLWQLDDTALANFLNQKLGMAITESDISHSYRLPNTKPGTGQTLVVTFRTRKLRDKIYRARKQLRNINSSVYINELLTKPNAKLSSLARQLVKKNYFTALGQWTES